MKDFIQLKKNIKKDFSNLKSMRVAVLGDTATQFLAMALKGLGYDKSINLDIWEADYNQIEGQVLVPKSELYSFEPETTIISRSSQTLLLKYNKTISTERLNFALNEIEEIKELYSNLSMNSDTKIIFYNYSEINDSIFGNFANKVESSFLFQQRKLNFLLMEFASNSSKFNICDLSSIQNKIGKENLFHTSSYINNSMVLSIDALPLIASHTLNIIQTSNGLFKKCIIIDLDNTTWGGVIGDDGIENIRIGDLGIGKAFSEFQFWVKKLKERGVIIAVCSKNTDSIAKVPFEEHPDMIIRLEDISVFIANWENKADNIRHIQNVLNIGFDSMVFIDDNPFERNIVRDNIPEICVPEMPEDPADYLEYLYGLNLFETSSYSNEDAERTKKYQIESKRVSAQKKYTNEDDFLESLNMLSLIEPFDLFNIPRVAQLSQRSNQFNLRTIRYSEKEIKEISIDENQFSFAFNLEDNFGKHGLICVVILKKQNNKTLFIDTWFMSCRILKRGMEKFVLNHLVDFSRKNKFDFIVGEYIETTKNKLVQNHYLDLGFKKKGNKWLLPTESYNELKMYIKKMKHE